MTIEEATGMYSGKHVDLNLSDAEYQTLKTLHRVATERASLEDEQKKSDKFDGHRRAMEKLQDVGFAFDHHDEHRADAILIPGDAAVLMTRRTAMIATKENIEFMRSEPAKALIDKIRAELGRGPDGFAHDW